MLDLEFAELSDTGPTRDNNEDCCGHFVPATPEAAQSRGWCFAVADGVGGQAGGEVASRLAIETLLSRLPSISSTESLTLASNFGTFVLYMLSCITCMVAFHRHPKFNPVLHLFIPLFGLAANLACMAFYLIGPFMGYGAKKEPLLALGIAAVWGIYGGIYFLRSSKKSGRTTLIQERAAKISA